MRARHAQVIFDTGIAANQPFDLASEKIEINISHLSTAPTLFRR
jgi:hypothetical protein